MCDFRPVVIEVFALLKCYAAFIELFTDVSWQQFGRIFDGLLEMLDPSKCTDRQFQNSGNIPEERKTKKTSQLMLYREIIAVCSQIYTKHINTLCEQNAELYIKIHSIPLSKHTTSQLYKPVS